MRNSDDRHTLGKRGEDLASAFLEKKGYTLIERNFRRLDGEIDLIMKDKNTLVFVEVRTRFGEDGGEPEETIGKAKIAQLTDMAELYQFIKNYYGRARIDAVCVHIRSDGMLERIAHYENIGFMEA